jgi:hypothetical protein
MINDKIEETQVVRPFNSDYTDIMSMLSKYDKAKTVVVPANATGDSHNEQSNSMDGGEGSANLGQSEVEKDNAGGEIMEEVKESSEIAVGGQMEI